MKIDVNALLGLGVLAITILGGWVAYLQIVAKPNKKETKDSELEERVETLEKEMKTYKSKTNGIIKAWKKKSSFN